MTRNFCLRTETVDGLPPHGTAIERLQQLRTTGQRSRGLRIRHPLAFPLVHLGPLVLLAVDCNLEEVVGRLGRVGRQ